MVRKKHEFDDFFDGPPEDENYLPKNNEPAETPTAPDTPPAYELEASDYPVVIKDEEIEAVTVSRQAAAIVKSELQTMNMYLGNINKCFSYAGSINDVCQLVKTGMGVIKDRRDLFTRLQPSTERVTTRPEDIIDGPLHPLS